MAKNYQELVQMVQEITGNSTKSDFTRIDISSLQGTAAKKRRPPFGPLIALAMGIESGHMPTGPSKHPATASQIPVPPSLQQAEKKEAAKLELGEFAGRLNQSQASTTPTNLSSGINMANDAALTKLSIQDQISKLERITYGLKNGMFDKKHLKLIKKDVNALNKQIAKEMKKAMKSNTNKSAVEQEFIKLRDHKLNEVMGMLSGAK